MAVSRSSLSAPKSSARATGVASGLLFVVLLIMAGVTWVLPVEVFQQWAYERAKPEPYARFEAIGSAEFLTWCGRIVFPPLTVACGLVWRNRIGLSEFLADLRCGLMQLTGSIAADGKRAGVGRVSRLLYRSLLVAWVLLFITHAAYGIKQRAADWPYFRWNSGQTVLPNISDSNRAVIRYLQARTPSDAKILVVSDQKLFFLSYYLRPRTLFHRMHPESEHVIPLKDQQRKLSAYRLDELSADDLKQIPYDYTLEYFEHPDLVDRAHVLDDREWVSFLRAQQHDPQLVPTYQVRLRKVGDRMK